MLGIMYVVHYGLYYKDATCKYEPASFAKNVSYVLCYADKSDMGHTVWSKIEIDIFTLYSMACVLKMQHANMGPVSFAT